VIVAYLEGAGPSVPIRVGQLEWLKFTLGVIGETTIGVCFERHRFLTILCLTIQHSRLPPPAW